MIWNPVANWSALALLSLLCCAACTPSRLVQPLEQGESAAGISFGGPLFEYHEKTIPMPLSSLYGAYGVTEQISAFAGIHTTALVYGLAQVDLGWLQEWMQPLDWRPGISFSPALYIMVDTWEGHWRGYPSLDVNAWWPTHTGYYYIGSANWLELQQTRAHGEPQQEHWLFNLHAGYTHRRDLWDYTAEVKYLLPTESNRDIVVNYTGIQGQGAIGLYLSIVRRWP